jgi:hypothetical protein
MSDTNYEYECALSGIVAPGELKFDKDGLGDLPQGWTEVRLSRRYFNPKWVLIQQVKDAMVRGLIAQFDEGSQQAQQVAIRLQIDSQFFALEQDTPVYLTETETVYLSSPNLSPEVAEEYNKARELLGLEPVEPEDEEEEEEEEDDEEGK